MEERIVQLGSLLYCYYNSGQVVVTLGQRTTEIRAPATDTQYATTQTPLGVDDGRVRK